MERRRIYDIVNVLESIGVSFSSLGGLLCVSEDSVKVHLLREWTWFQVLARKAKNQYNWKGSGGIPGALKKLKVVPSRRFNAEISTS